MEEPHIDYCKLICEIEEVKRLLVIKGIKEDVNANVIFEKLERKTVEDHRVDEVVREIISEINLKEPDLIILEDARKSPDVEILVDLTNNFHTPVSEFGTVANNAREIFERERHKRIGSSTSDSYSETSKRARESSGCDFLFDDSLPLEEIEVIESIALENDSSNDADDVKSAVSDEATKNNLLQMRKLASEEACCSREISTEQKALSAPGELTYINKEESHQGTGDFLFNNIDLGSGAYCFEKNITVDENEAPTSHTSVINESTWNVEVPKNVSSSLLQPEPNDKIEIPPSLGVSKIEDVVSSLLKDPKPDEEVEILTLPGVAKNEDALSPTSQLPGPSNKIEIPTNHGNESVQTSNHVDKHLIRAQHRYLKAVLPQIDSSYLKSVVRQCGGSQKLLNNFVRSAYESDARLKLSLRSHTVTKFEDEQPSSSFNSFQGTSRQSEREMLLNYRVTTRAEVPIKKEELQVDLVGSSIDNTEGAVGGTTAIATAAESLEIAPETEELKMEVDASDADKAELYADQLQYLVAVLPDADPTFLEGLVRDLEGDQERLKDFVTNALDNYGDKQLYPTRGECQQKKEQEALIKRFTDNFSMEDFLQVFPDPIGHFESETRQAQGYHEHSMAYLRSKFRHLFINDIASALRRRNFNLTLAALDLSNWKSIKRKTKRSPGDCKWPKEQSVAFLQEVAYYENRDKIKQFIEEKKSKRQRAFDEAKANNELLTCGCCFDDELLFEDMSACSEGHLFCKDCIKKGAEVIIGDGKSHFPCMDGSCKADFSLATLQGVLTSAIFGKLVQRLQLEEINAAGIEGLETCPSCPYSTIPAPEDKIFKCLNPECMKETCRICKEASHIPLRCEEVEKNTEVRVRTYIEDKMTEALIRTCWKCNKKFIKEGGCNKMTCSCGALMCYVCRQPVKDYKHFNPEPHRESDLCPLYSNDGMLNFNAVKAEGEKAKEEVMRQNPEVRLVHDPTLKLPDVPTTPQPPPEPMHHQQMLEHIHQQFYQDLNRIHPQVHRHRQRVRRHVHQLPIQLEERLRDVEELIRTGRNRRVARIAPAAEEANAHHVYPPPPPRNHVPFRR